MFDLSGVCNEVFQKIQKDIKVNTFSCFMLNIESLLKVGIYLETNVAAKAVFTQTHPIRFFTDLHKNLSGI